MDKDVFIKLGNIATTSVEFSFNNKMYKQNDGVAVSCPLGPALANIFFGYHKEKLFTDNNQPLMLKLYSIKLILCRVLYPFNFKLDHLLG